MDTMQPIRWTQLQDMNINTAQTEPITPKSPSVRRPLRSAVAAVALLLVSLVFTQASTVLGPWVPMFKGVDHAVGTNTAAGGGYPDLMVVHFMRVDLTDPDIRFYASPRL